MLTIIDPLTSLNQFVWAVANSKVLCFYHSQNYLNFIKLFRRSELNIKDIISTPCFNIMSELDQEVEEKKYLVCASSVEEKEIWVKTLNSNN